MSDTLENHFIIGVPTFNRSHLISRVVDSAQKQNYLKWTILFVDDCSSDETEKVIKEIAQSKSNINYVRLEENSGVNAVRNKIIELAKIIDENAFLVLIDDDDYLAPNALSTASKYISRNSSFNWFSLNCNYDDGAPITKIRQYGPRSYLKDYMFGKGIKGDLTHIIRLNSLKEEKFTNEFKNGEEWFFWVSLSLNHGLFTINAPGSIKEYLEGGLTETGINRDKAIQVLKYKIEVLSPIVGDEKMLHQYVSLAKNYLSKGNYEEASLLLIQVFKTSPLYFRQYRHWASLLIRKFLKGFQ